MSNSIKDIIKTFKSRQEQEEQVTENVVEEVKIDAPPTVVKKASVPAEKQQKLVKQEKRIKAELKAIDQENGEKPTKEIQFHLSDDFFNSLINQEFTYEDRRIAYLESDLYEVFMSLKRKKKLKNISVLINAILNQVVEDNKDYIKQILVNARL